MSNRIDRVVITGGSSGIGLDLARRFLEKDPARRAFPTRVGIRKKMSDVPLAQRTEHGIGNRVQERIGVRMAVETFAVRNFNAAQNEFSALDKPMDVVADADAVHGRGGYAEGVKRET